MSGLSIGNGLSTGNGLSAGSGFSRGGGLYFSGFSVAPTLNLDFTTMTALPSTITFSRPSNATYYDSTGKLTYAPNNLLTYSNTFTNAIWGKTNSPTLLAGVLDPTGGMNATRITTTANNTYLFEAVNIQPGVNTVTSIWVRRVSGTGAVNMWTAIGGTGPAITPTSTWTQFSTSGPVSIGTAVYCGLIISTAADVLEVYAATSSIVTYETTPRTQDQVITTSAAYYGARLDYNPATLAARGLLIEEARTNNIKYSNTLESTGSFWNSLSSSSSITATLNQIVSPNGTTDATLLTYPNNVSGAGTYAVWRYSFSTVANGTYTFSVWLRAGTTTSVWLRLNDNAGNRSSIQCSLTSAWQRFTLTGTTVATISAISTDIGADGNTGETLAAGTVYVWGAQLELGSFATSYIPTAASSVARSADSASMTGTNFSSWYNQSEGTFSANSETGGVTVAAFAAQATLAGFSSYIDVTRYQGGAVKAVIVDGSAQSSLTISASIVFGQIYKTAHAYKLNDVAGVANGGTVQTDTSATIPTLDRLLIGYTDNSYWLNGHIAYLVYYPQRLPNATLQSLTS